MNDKAEILAEIARVADRAAARIEPDSHDDDWIAYHAAQMAIEAFADELREAIGRLA